MPGVAAISVSVHTWSATPAAHRRGPSEGVAACGLGQSLVRLSEVVMHVRCCLLVPTWRVHLRNGSTLDVVADWLTEHYAGLTFESVVVIVNSPRWIVVRRNDRAELERIEQVT